MNTATEHTDDPKAWDKAAEVYTKMAIEMQRRRREKVAAGEPVAAVDETRCTWERAHPDEACPICAWPIEAQQHNLADAARDSQQHIADADTLADLLDAECVIELVLDAGVRLTRGAVLPWSEDERNAVKVWAEGQLGLTDGMPPRPAVLGTAHVAASIITSEGVLVPGGQTYQCCSVCGARIWSVETGGDCASDAYPSGTLVGTDCPGADVSHHYPAKKAKGKKAKK